MRNWACGPLVRINVLQDQIAADLPNLPAQVVEMWLAPMAADKGWPPPDYDLGNWRYTLGCKSLDFWRKTAWELGSLPFDLAALTPIGLHGIAEMLDAYVNGANNEYGAAILNGKERYKSLVLYIGRNGSFPAPTIVMARDDGLHIVDGNHRITALTRLRQCWNNEPSAARLLNEG